MPLLLSLLASAPTPNRRHTTRMIGRDCSPGRLSLVASWRQASHWSRGGGTHGDVTHEGCSCVGWNQHNCLYQHSCSRCRSMTVLHCSCSIHNVPWVHTTPSMPQNSTINTEFKQQSNGWTSNGRLTSVKISRYDIYWPSDCYILLVL